jgi:hypothetical protein
VKPNPEFLGKPPRFWAYAKLASEQVGYSKRNEGQLRTYTASEIRAVLHGMQLTISDALLAEVVAYLNWRGNVLNTQIASAFMNREEAALAHELVARTLKPTKPPPMNKQKGDKRHPAYLSAIVAAIAEGVVGPAGFIDDARKLAIVTEANGLEEIFSRRFDGALPSTNNPKAVWEIKEYYGTTTFGSRVADGVYETLLDGYEIEGVRSRMGREIAHFLFIDDRYTWWDCGKSYLCRMVDMLHTKHVDQIFFGKEVLTEWEPALRALVK